MFRGQVPWPTYQPPYYTDQSVLENNEWADTELSTSTKAKQVSLTFNNFDYRFNVNRTSHLGKYQIVDFLPRNPRGRTGLTGRGLLGRYGPNHAADPIVTRWERDADGQVVHIKDKPVLEFVAILRRSSDDWAIPGGMVNPGESLSKTLRKKFLEKVKIKSKNNEDDEVEEEKVKTFLKFEGVEIFRGYCDDFRNTDLSWVETLVMNYHDGDGSIFKKILLKPGRDASKVEWKRVEKNLKLFASHQEYLRLASERHNAYF